MVTHKNMGNLACKLSVVLQVIPTNIHSTCVDHECLLEQSLKLYNMKYRLRLNQLQHEMKKSDDGL